MVRSLQLSGSTNGWFLKPVYFHTLTSGSSSLLGNEMWWQFCFLFFVLFLHNMPKVESVEGTVGIFFFIVYRFSRLSSLQISNFFRKYFDFHFFQSTRSLKLFGLFSVISRWNRGGKKLTHFDSNALRKNAYLTFSKKRHEMFTVLRSCYWEDFTSTRDPFAETCGYILLASDIWPCVYLNGSR